MTHASVYWIETTEEELHFIDSIISAYDGLASVRRNYRLRDGCMEYKVFVSPGMESEFLELMDRLTPATGIRGVTREDDRAQSS